MRFPSYSLPSSSRGPLPFTSGAPAFKARATQGTVHRGKSSSFSRDAHRMDNAPTGTHGNRGGTGIERGGFPAVNLESQSRGNRDHAPRTRRADSVFLSSIVDLADACPFIEHTTLHSEHIVASTTLPRVRFSGPCGGDDTIRIGVFATIHGDEPGSGLGLLHFLQQLGQDPSVAQGFVIDAFPICNPTGYENGTRTSRSGKDLNREFWNGSQEPEVQILENVILERRYHGIVSLHCDDTSHGLYGFLSGKNSGAVLSANLLEPALAATEAFLPRNLDAKIDGFHARNGILSSCYDGVLRAPNTVSPPPFEITFETPQRAPEDLQVLAFNAALLTILTEYRNLQAYGQHL